MRWAKVDVITRVSNKKVVDNDKINNFSIQLNGAISFDFFYNFNDLFIINDKFFCIFEHVLKLSLPIDFLFYQMLMSKRKNEHRRNSVQ